MQPNANKIPIEQVIFRELPARYSDLEGKKLGFAKRVRGAWKKGLSEKQERYARAILKGLLWDEKHGRVQYCGEAGLIDLDDEGDNETGREMAGNYAEF